MENIFEVHAEARTDEGKGASRRLRHAGKVPAVVYGTDKEAVSITLDHNRFIRHLAEDAFYAHILTLVIDGKKDQVVLKDLQRHPANDNKIIHADFLRIDAKHEMTMVVQLHFVNEEKSAAVKAGGLVSRVITEVEISCLPTDLPEYIEVDIENLQLDESIHLSEIVLPKGVTLTALAHDDSVADGERSSYDQAVVSVHMPRQQAVEDEDAEDDSAASDAATEE